MSKKKINRPVITPSSTEAPANNSSVQQPTSFFDGLSRPIMALLVIGVIFLISGLIFKDFLFQKKYYLFTDGGGDMFAQAYPDLIHFAHYFRTEGLIPGWSFSVGLGQNIYPFFLDLTNLLTLSTDPKAIAGGLIYVDIFLMILSGGIFYAYLRTIPVSRFSALIGAVCIANGYIFIISGWSNHLMNEIPIAALILFSIERLLQRNQWYWIPLPFMWASIIQPFYLFIFGLMAGIYWLVRVLEQEQITWDKRIKSGLLLVGLALLGAAMAGFLLGSNIYQLLDSPRGSGEVSYAGTLMAQPMFGLADKKILQTELLRFFSNDLQGIANEFKGYGNYYEAPIYYSSWLMVLLMPLAFIGVSNRQRLVRAVLIVLITLPLFFPYFRFAFWAFTGDYYRAYSLFVSVLLLYLSISGLDALQLQVNKKIIWIGGAILLSIILLLLPDAQTAEVNKSLRSLVIFGLFGYGLLLWVSTTAMQRYAQIAIILILVVEFSYSHTQSLKKRPTYSSQQLENRELLNDYSVDAINYVKKIDPTFYRITEEAPITKNDPEAKGYHGTSAYHSFNSLNYIKFLQGLGLIQSGNEFQTRWIDGLFTQPVLATLVSTKYVVVKATNGALLTAMGFDSLATFGDTKVFKNRNYIPFGFTYDRWMERSDFDKLSGDDKQISMLQAVVLDSTQNDLKRLLRQLTIAEYDTNKTVSYYDVIADLASQQRKDTLSILSFSQNQLLGSITTNSPQLLFFSFPFDAGWKAQLDGIPVTLQKVQIGLTGLFLPPGKHTVLLSYEPPYQKAGSWVSLVAFLMYGGLLGFTFLRTKPNKATASEEV
ncbi:MAG: YfhO family protein [Spirosomataceae bacterium]